MTNYKTLFADILGLDPSRHDTFKRSDRLHVELSSDDRSIVYDNDQGLLAVYSTFSKRLEIWKAISSDNDLFSFEESKTIDNDSLTFLQSVSLKWVQEWQAYEDKIGNNGETVESFNEDRYER